MRVPQATTDFYLVSTEGHVSEPPRRVSRLRTLTTDRGTDLLLVQVDPPFLYANRPLAEMILAARHEGNTITRIEEWPFYVYVALASSEFEKGCPKTDVICAQELVVIDWAELYPTESAALDATRSTLD